MIIFLDIDGVLNTGGVNAKYSWVDHLDHRNWVPELVSHLYNIIVLTKASVVVSSSWRNLNDDVSWWNEEFIKAKLPPVVVGITPSYGGFRGKEVDAWIKENNYQGKYLIIDDSSDFYPHQPRLRTDGALGLTKYHVSEALDYYSNATDCLNKTCMVDYRE